MGYETMVKDLVSLFDRPRLKAFMYLIVDKVLDYIYG